MPASALPRRTPWSAEVAHYRAVVAGMHHRPADDPELLAARHSLRVAMAKGWAQRLRDANVPGLTPEQRAEVAAIIGATP